jgi:tetratricopeptide (TPR) repeat protein
MWTFLSKLEAKDWVTLAASFAAIVLSILSFRQKATDMELAKRKQLTDLLEKITDLNTERAKYELKKSEYPESYGGLIADQRRFFARQAAFLMDRIPHLVTPFEYQLVAASFGDIGDGYEAERLFELAVSVSVTPMDRGIAVRRYGAWFFDLGLPDEARKRFEAALECFEGESDQARDYRADTYLRWSNYEKRWTEDPRRARDLLERAATESRAMRNPARREWWASRMRRHLDDLSATGSKPVDAPPPDTPREGDPR